MNFASDNAYGVLPEILAALGAAGEIAEPAYGADAVTQALAGRFDTLFERKVKMFPVLTGTAANALALATITPPHGAILCHEDSHIMVHECGAPEFFTHGARLVGLSGGHGKLTPETIAAALTRLPRGDVHVVQPFAISLTQSTEFGTVYSPDEIAAISAVARAQGLKLHMDGARFANAMAALGCTPAEATWKCGVDVLSFGATKGGALAAEAVVFFDPALAANMAERRKRAGHLISKHRFLALQMQAFLADDCWLKLARHANAMADRLAAGLSGIGLAPVWPVEANLVFVSVTKAVEARLRAAGARYYVRRSESLPASASLGPDRALIRLVTSFATRDEEIDRFVALAAKA
jgi:threonine aldolase